MKGSFIGIALLKPEKTSHFLDNYFLNLTFCSLVKTDNSVLSSHLSLPLSYITFSLVSGFLHISIQNDW